MAKDFYMDTSGTTYATYNGRYLYLYCTQTQDIARNKSIIKYTIASVGGSTYYATGPTNITIGGKTIYSSDRIPWYGTGSASNPVPTFPAAPGTIDGTVEIDHDSDGSKKILCTITSAIFHGAANAETASKYWELDDIPRAATLTSAPNFKDSDNPVIGYSNPAGSAATVQACITNSDGSIQYVKYRSISSTGTSYTFSLTSAEREVLKNAVPIGTNTLSVRFYIKTIINGSTVGFDYLTRTLTVKREAVLTSAPNFTDEDNPTITYSNPNGNTVDDVQVCIASKSGDKIIVKYRSVSETGSSYTFYLTDEERAALIAEVPSGKNTLEVSFYVKTDIDGATYGYKRIIKTMTVINATPEISSYSIKDVGAHSTYLTNNPDVIIKGFNVVNVSMVSTTKKGALIVSQSITNYGGETIEGSSAQFSYVETNKFIFKITDSFGQTVSRTETVAMVDYIKLTCNLKVNNPTGDGSLTFTINGNYFNNKFGNLGIDNSLVLEWRIKDNTNGYGDWIPVTFTLDGNTYNTSVTLTGLDYKSTYTIQARATDALKTEGTYSLEYSVKSEPVFNWGKNNFDIRVPLTVNDIQCENTFDGALELGSYDSKTGVKQDNANSYRNVDVFEVEGNESYIFYVNGVTQRIVVLFYDENYIFISETRSVQNDGAFATPSNAKYVNFRCFQSEFTSAYSDLKVEIKKASPIRTKTINGSSIFGAGNLSISSIVIYDKTLTADDTEVVVSSLNMLHDGGEYEIELRMVNGGNDTTSDIRLTFNDISTGYNHTVWKAQASTSVSGETLTPVAYYYQNVEAIYHFQHSPKQASFPAVLRGRLFLTPVIDGSGYKVSYNLNYSQAISGEQIRIMTDGVNSATVNNVTLIRFTLTRNDVFFGAGTRVIVKKVL